MSRSGKNAAMGRLGQTLRRFVVLGAIAFWIGGFTFYTGVVVHVGAAVLQSHRRQGFITEHVTNWLNLSGGIVLVILLWELLASRSVGKWARRAMIFSWIAMVALQVALVAVHPMMDRLLDPQAREILDDPKFSTLHDVYVWVSTIQWCAALLFIFAMLWAWGAADRKILNGARSTVADEQSCTAQQI